MSRFSTKFLKGFWFMSGFAIGFTLISLSQAALPKRATPPIHRALSGAAVSEISGAKVNSPEFDQDFTSLNYQEGKYAENWDQQQRIRSAVNPSAKVRYRPMTAQAPIQQPILTSAARPATPAARRAARPAQQAQKVHRKAKYPAQQAQKVRLKAKVAPKSDAAL